MLEGLSTTSTGSGLTLAALPVEVWVYGGIGAAVVVAIVGAVLCYKPCPPDKLLVVYGIVGKDRAFKVAYGGAIVLPLLQGYGYVTLEPQVLAVERGVFTTRDGVNVVLDGSFTVGVSSGRSRAEAAAEKLLDVPDAEVREQAGSVLVNRLGAVIEQLDAREVDAQRAEFGERLAEGIDAGLSGLGMTLISFTINRIEGQPT